jgi:hypothetical protein
MTVKEWIETHFEPSKSTYKTGSFCLKHKCEHDINKRVRKSEFDQAMSELFAVVKVSPGEGSFYKMKEKR